MFYLFTKLYSKLLNKDELRTQYYQVSKTIHAEVVTFVAGSLEAGGLPEYLEAFLSLK
jgi:hypothetical protein